MLFAAILPFLAQDPSIEAYVKGVAARLPSGATPYQIEILKVDNQKEPMVSVPEKKLVVPTGMFLAAQDEGEFAAMLAHSIAHFAVGSSSRPAKTGSPQVRFVMGHTETSGQGIAFLPSLMMESQRNLELEADAWAIGALSRAGYEAQALRRYISRIQPEDSPRYSGLPPKQQRLAMMDGLLGALPPASVRAPSADGGEFTRIRAELSKRPIPTLKKARLMN